MDASALLLLQQFTDKLLIVRVAAFSYGATRDNLTRRQWYTSCY